MAPKMIAKRGSGLAQSKLQLPGLLARIAPVLLLLGAFALRVYHLDGQSFWWDEAKSAQRAAMSLGQLAADLLNKPNQLPLYYLILQVWSRVGQSEFVLRYFSVLVGMLVSALFYPAARLVGGRRAGIVAVFLATISPFQIWYAQEARMYILLLGTTLAANWFLMRLAQGATGKLWLGYGVALATGVFTHYFAFLIILSHYIPLALNYRRRRSLFWSWAVTVVAVGLLFLPYALVVMNSTGYDTAVPAWIPQIRWFEPLLTLFVLSNGPTAPLRHPAPWLILILHLLAVTVVLWKARRLTGGKRLHYQILLWSMLVPLLLVYLLSLDWQNSLLPAWSLYVDRYLIIILPSYLLLASWGLAILTRRRVIALPLLLLITLSVLPALNRYYFNPAHARDDWRSTVAFLDDAGEQGDAILAGKDLEVPWDYYGDDPLDYFELPLPYEGDSAPVSWEAEMEASLCSAARHADYGWLLSRAYGHNPHGFKGPRNAALRDARPLTQHEAWLGAFLPVSEVRQYLGVRLTRYELSAAAEHCTPSTGWVAPEIGALPSWH